MENDTVSNDCELEESLLEPLIKNVSRSPPTEDTDMACSHLERRQNFNCNSDDHDKDEETNQTQQSKKQKMVRIFNTN